MVWPEQCYLTMCMLLWLIIEYKSMGATVRMEEENGQFIISSSYEALVIQTWKILYI